MDSLSDPFGTNCLPLNSRPGGVSSPWNGDVEITWIDISSFDRGASGSACRECDADTSTDKLLSKLLSLTIP